MKSRRSTRKKRLIAENAIDSWRIAGSSPVLRLAYRNCTVSCGASSAIAATVQKSRHLTDGSPPSRSAAAWLRHGMILSDSGLVRAGRSPRKKYSGALLTRLRGSALSRLMRLCFCPRSPGCLEQSTKNREPTVLKRLEAKSARTETANRSAAPTWASSWPIAWHAETSETTSASTARELPARCPSTCHGSQPARAQQGSSGPDLTPCLRR